MDVRGPADYDGNKLQERRELTRYESAQGPANPKTPQLAMQDVASEVAQLGQQLKSVPEVRAELVTQAIANLKEGHYSTRASAEKTAEAILALHRTE